VSLISLQPNKLVFTRLGREIAFDDLTIKPSLSGNQAGNARRNKKAPNILHGNSCEIT
jgi:hypothetical protein